MARIGPVKLDVRIKGEKATVDVTYDILFSQTDVKKKQSYQEECRIIGDDTHRADPPEAGGDDTLSSSPRCSTSRSSRADRDRVEAPPETFRALDLNEDQGSIPNPDEVRALVTLRPALPATGKPVQGQSPMVKLTMG